MFIPDINRMRKNGQSNFKAWTFKTKKNFNQLVECCVHAQIIAELFSGIKSPGS